MTDNLPKLDLSRNFQRVYPNYDFVGIAQFYVPGAGWTDQLRGHNFESLELVCVEQQLDFLIKCGVDKVTVEMVNKHNKSPFYSDFIISELITDGKDN